MWLVFELYEKQVVDPFRVGGKWCTALQRVDTFRVAGDAISTGYKGSTLKGSNRGEGVGVNNVVPFKVVMEKR